MRRILDGIYLYCGALAALFLSLIAVTILAQIVGRMFAITIDSDVREDGSRRTTKYEIDLFKCIYCGFCEESCPVDSIVETDIHEFHFESKGKNVMTKEQLLAIGDMYEEQIANSRQQDAKYR